MYQKGDYVVKFNDGICRIENIVRMDTVVAKTNKMYYLMIPENEKKARLYVPVDKENESFRRIMTKEEVWNLIDHIPDIEEIWISDDRLREQKYKEALKSCNPERLIEIIKSMYMRKKERIAKGKKNTVIDERYFKLAEETLYSEFAFVIGGNKDEMTKLISERLKGKDIANVQREMQQESCLT